MIHYWVLQQRSAIVCFANLLVRVFLLLCLWLHYLHKNVCKCNVKSWDLWTNWQVISHRHVKNTRSKRVWVTCWRRCSRWDVSESQQWWQWSCWTNVRKRPCTDCGLRQTLDRLDWRASCLRRQCSYSALQTTSHCNTLQYSTSSQKLTAIPTCDVASRIRQQVTLILTITVCHHTKTCGVEYWK